jgi:hypothetical protein
MSTRQALHVLVSLIAVRDANGQEVGQFFSGQLGFVPSSIAGNPQTLNSLRQCMLDFAAIESGPTTGGTTKLSSDCVQVLSDDDVPIPAAARPSRRPYRLAGRRLPLCGINRHRPGGGRSRFLWSQAQIVTWRHRCDTGGARVRVLPRVSQRAASPTAPAWSKLGVSHDRARASAWGCRTP